MMLAQTKSWHASSQRDSTVVELGLLRDGLAEEHRELRDFQLEIPFEKWNFVVKYVRCDRKLLGGVVLEFANEKDQLAVILGNDRLYGELQRAVIDASVALIENGILVVSEGEPGQT
jgi:hypothetical protein